MVESLELIAVITVFGVILFWYLQNIQAGTDGTRGLLALHDDPEITQAAELRSSYRNKSRLAKRRQSNNTPHAVQALPTALPNPTPADQNFTRSAQMHRKFRRQDEARYRVKDKLQEP